MAAEALIAMGQLALSVFVAACLVIGGLYVLAGGSVSERIVGALGVALGVLVVIALGMR